jgi:hypothetical protein
MGLFSFLLSIFFLKYKKLLSLIEKDIQAFPSSLSLSLSLSLSHAHSLRYHRIEAFHLLNE